MSVTYISAALRRLVEERAKYRCEYCLLPTKVSFFSHEIDHVIAEKHGVEQTLIICVSPVGVVTAIKVLI